MSIEEISSIVQIIASSINLLALIIGAIWILYRFYANEKPKFSLEMESIKPSINLSMKINEYIINDIKCIAVELLIKNCGTRIGFIEKKGVTLTPVNIVDNEIFLDIDNNSICNGMYSVEMETFFLEYGDEENFDHIYLFPNEEINLCFITKIVDKGLYLIRGRTLGTLEPDADDSELTFWTRDEFYYVS